MTPAARHQAAIEILDTIAEGAPAERVLTNWGRAHRFAGSGDRAAIRDIVFAVLRRRRSCAWSGGGDTGRALVLGLLRQEGPPPETIFTGARHAPAPLSEAETAAPPPLDTAPRGVRTDMPDWLLPRLDTAFPGEADAICEALRHRAPAFLRANLRKTTRDSAADALAAEGIETRPHPLSPTALEVTSGARRIAASRAYREGLVELQDAASQAVADLLPVKPGQRVLDYCAGGGGKVLALAARCEAAYTAHDADKQRMADLPARAARAGVAGMIRTDPAPQGPFDLVFADAPCSGSGAWRRSPEAKWQLTEAALESLVRLQAEILDTAATLTAPGGTLAYATCSLLEEENAAQIAAFRNRHDAWEITAERRFRPADGGDGFYVACLRHSGPRAPG